MTEEPQEPVKGDAKLPQNSEPRMSADKIDHTSAFDEKPPFKKRITTVSLTEQQRTELDRMKAQLHITTDGALIKRALRDLSHALGREDDA